MFSTNVDVKLFLNNHVEKMTLSYDETLILAWVQEFHITIEQISLKRKIRICLITLRKFNITDVKPLRVKFFDN